MPPLWSGLSGTGTDKLQLQGKKNQFYKKSWSKICRSRRDYPQKSLKLPLENVLEL